MGVFGPQLTGFLSAGPWSPAPAVCWSSALLSSSPLVCVSVFLQFPPWLLQPPPQPPHSEQMASLPCSGREAAGRHSPFQPPLLRLHPRTHSSLSTQELTTSSHSSPSWIPSLLFPWPFAQSSRFSPHTAAPVLCSPTTVLDFQLFTLERSDVDFVCAFHSRLLPLQSGFSSPLSFQDFTKVFRSSLTPSARASCVSTLLHLSVGVVFSRILPAVRAAARACPVPPLPPAPCPAPFRVPCFLRQRGRPVPPGPRMAHGRRSVCVK